MGNKQSKNEAKQAVEKDDNNTSNDSDLQFGYTSPAEEEPKIIEFNTKTIETDNNSTSKTLTFYKFSNNNTFDRRIAIYCTNFLSNSLRLQLISNAKRLEDTIYDFRYPMKDKILIGKLGGGRAPWTCENCLYEQERVWSFGIEHKCNKCGVVWGKEYNMGDKQRMNYLIKQYTDYNNYINDNQQYKKWGVCIQSLIDPLLNNTDKYWIPNTIHVDKDYNISFISEINNLSRIKYNKLYNIFGIILSSMIKMFEWILEIKLCSKDLQIIITMQKYKLMSHKTFKGTLHCEGFKEESIACVGVYYFDKSSLFDIDEFQIAMNLFGVCGGPHSITTKNINISQGSCMVFSNRNLVHKLDKLRNGDDTKDAERRILTFFLIDPIYDNDKENKTGKMSQRMKTEIEEKEISMFSRICRTDEIPRKILSTTNHILVNMQDKLEMVVSNLYKSIILSDDIPKDVVSLIVQFVEGTMITKRMQRDRLRVQRMVPQKSGVHLPWFIRVN